MGTRKRWTGQRAVPVARWRRDVDQADRPRPASQDDRQGDAGDRALKPEAGLRDHRDRRRPAVPWPGHRSRTAVAVRRWWRQLEDGEHRSQRPRPHGVLRADGRLDRQRERDLLPERVVQQVDRRRRDAGAAERPRSAGRRSPRHVDRSDQRQPHDRRTRSGRLGLADARPDVAEAAARQRAAVSRDGRQPGAVLRLHEQAGRPVVPRTEQQPARRRRWARWWRRRPRRHPARHVALDRRRRERLRDARSRRSEHHLVDRLRLRQRRRHRRSLRGEPASAARRRSLARQREWSGGRLEVPLHLGRAVPHLAARSQQDLRRQPASSSVDRWRSELAGDQSGRHAERQDAPAELWRSDARQHRRRVRRSHSRDCRVAEAGGRDLGRHQRRPGPGDARRRQELDERHQEHPEPAAVGDGGEHRAVAVRRRHGLRRDRFPSGEQPRSVRL